MLELQGNIVRDRRTGRRTDGRMEWQYLSAPMAAESKNWSRKVHPNEASYGFTKGWYIIMT